MKETWQEVEFRGHTYCIDTTYNSDLTDKVMYENILDLLGETNNVGYAYIDKDGTIYRYKTKIGTVEDIKLKGSYDE